MAQILTPTTMTKPVISPGEQQHDFRISHRVHFMRSDSQGAAKGN